MLTVLMVMILMTIYDANPHYNTFIQVNLVALKPMYYQKRGNAIW